MKPVYNWEVYGVKGGSGERRIRLIINIMWPGGRKDSLNLCGRVAFPSILRVLIISGRRRLKQRKQPANRILLIGILSG
jgi:hypothetical protein